MSDDRAAKYEAEVRRANEALGRYLVAYSRLVFGMRQSLAFAVQWRGGDMHVINLLTGEMQMYNLNNAFFGVFRHLGEHDEAEADISRALFNSVRRLNEVRNNIAHGEWWIGYGTEESREPDDPTVVLMRPGSKSDPLRVHDFPVEEIDAATADVQHLNRMITEYAYRIAPHPGSEPPIRVSEVFVVRDGRVFRDGPRAAEAGTWFGYGP